MRFTFALGINLLVSLNDETSYLNKTGLYPVETWSGHVWDLRPNLGLCKESTPYPHKNFLTTSTPLTVQGKPLDL